MHKSLFEETNEENMTKEKLRSAILPSQLAEVTMKDWPRQSKNPKMVNKILDGLKKPANCSSVRTLILNKAFAKNRKIIPFHKKAEKRLSYIQKELVFATSAVLEIAGILTLAQNKN